jgi:hypothetical protein
MHNQWMLPKIFWQYTQHRKKMNNDIDNLCGPKKIQKNTYQMVIIILGMFPTMGTALGKGSHNLNRG